MMTDEEEYQSLLKGFCQQLVENPLDDGLKAIFADWLEEHLNKLPASLPAVIYFRSIDLISILGHLRQWQAGVFYDSIYTALTGHRSLSVRYLDGLPARVCFYEPTAVRQLPWLVKELPIKRVECPAEYLPTRGQLSVSRIFEQCQIKVPYFAPKHKEIPKNPNKEETQSWFGWRSRLLARTHEYQDHTEELLRDALSGLLVNWARRKAGLPILVEL